MVSKPRWTSWFWALNCAKLSKFQFGITDVEPSSSRSDSLCVIGRCRPGLIC